MNHGSLFSGIGGFDLAASWMGWNNVFHCEINPFCQKVLKYHFPESISYDDICKSDFTIHRGQIDILTGGFPCQPYSVSGKRKGTEDARHLWPEMLRAIRECKPTWIVGENVPGIISWSKGLVFEQVCADLEDEGYEVQPVILPACGVNADHRRERVFFIAHTNGIRHQGREKNWSKTKTWRQIQVSLTPRIKQLERLLPADTWTFLSESRIEFSKNGLSSRLDIITFPKWLIESTKSAGNAIVPQVAYQIFKAIEQINHRS